MKKFTLTILCAILVMALISIPVFAADGGSAAVSSVAGNPGDTVELVVSLKGFDAADTIGVTVKTDEGLTLDYSKSEWQLEGGMADINAKNQAAWCAEVDAVNVNVDVLKLVFTVPALGENETEKAFEVTCTVIVKNGDEELGTVTATGEVTAQATISGVSLDQNTLSLDINGGTTGKLTATILPDGLTGKISWTSSNTEVVEVDESGNLTAKKTGRALNTSNVDNKSATCVVTVSCSH